MSAIWRSLLRDERGFVITAELVLISTVLVLGLVAALSAVKTALAGELSDVAGAIGSVNQSYYTHGFHGCGARVYGSSFLDEADSSDEQKADFATGLETCPATAVAIARTDCVTPPCGSPCGTPCGTPCGAAVASSCGTPCGSPGPRADGCGSTWGQSVPPVICPPGPGPFTGTDPFAPGAVSPVNMYLQGISYGGVCAPPPAAPEHPAPCPEPVSHQQPCAELPAMPQPCGQGPLASPGDTAAGAAWQPTFPAAYEAPYEPAFFPPLPPRGTVF